MFFVVTVAFQRNRGLIIFVLMKSALTPSAPRAALSRGYNLLRLPSILLKKLMPLSSLKSKFSLALD